MEVVELPTSVSISLSVSSSSSPSKKTPAHSPLQRTSGSSFRHIRKGARSNWMAIQSSRPPTMP